MRVVGTNPALQVGTCNSFPVEADEHFYTVCRYVERNALRAKLVRRAEAWPWSSLGGSQHPAAAAELPPLSAWPPPRPRDWVAQVNRPQTETVIPVCRIARSSAAARLLIGDALA